MSETMTSMELGIPDRVPFFLPVTLHGAPACGLSIEEYFSKPDLIIEAEIRLAIRKGGPGGGFLHTDNHGEIPREGRYPLQAAADTQ